MIAFWRRLMTQETLYTDCCIERVGAHSINHVDSLLSPSQLPHRRPHIFGAPSRRGVQTLRPMLVLWLQTLGPIKREGATVLVKP